MKKILSIVMVMAGVLCLASCKGKEEATPEQPVGVTLSVTEIANNCATVNATATGSTSGKIIVGIPVSEVTVDYESQIKLISFIESKGETAAFPFTKSLSKLKAGSDYFSAVLVYDNNGRAADAKYEIWTAEGVADGWSQENNAGQLNPNIW